MHSADDNCEPSKSWLVAFYGLLSLGKLTATLGFPMVFGRMIPFDYIFSSKPRAHPSDTSGTVGKFDADSRDAI